MNFHNCFSSQDMFAHERMMSLQGGVEDTQIVPKEWMDTLSKQQIMGPQVVARSLACWSGVPSQSCDEANRIPKGPYGRSFRKRISVIFFFRSFAPGLGVPMVSQGPYMYGVM